jgi:glutathione S-transferase
MSVVAADQRDPKMKLFVTPTSPYARMVTIVRQELQLAEAVELVWTRTRQPNDPMLAFNPSGRIPFLLLSDGTGLEDSYLIIEYLDRLSAPRRFGRPEFGMVCSSAYWDFRRMEVTARSMLDGLSVWGREIVRPKGEQSPDIIEYENRRAIRLAGVFENLAEGKILSGPINIVQLFLFNSLNMSLRLPEFDWRLENPKLVTWFTAMLSLPSVRGSDPFAST